jgi:hypothetical protein
MMIWVSLVLAIASLGVSGAALALALRRPQALALGPAPAALPEPTPSPLEGLTVLVAIRQDHAHPVFANILSEILQKLDAEVSTVLIDDCPGPHARWSAEGAVLDLLISGTVVCNGYAEIYYQAELTCSTETDPICTLIDNPATGDRQANLAKELVSKIESEITKRLSRTERRLALRELRDGSLG